nr:MAG TPA: Tail fiber protein [Bacteriophage sp.]
MLGVNQLDFINYANALKGNYRKGVHKMEAIMASPTHAKEFASNLGGVSVVLSVPIGKEDRNSAQLLDLLLNSDVADDAVYTWLGQFYEFSSWDDLLGDESRCNEIMNDPLKSRAVSGSGVAVGKMVATIAGLSCSAYADMTAVAASSTAMTAIASAASALNAVLKNGTARTKFAGSSYLQSNFDKMLSSVGNTTYFSKKFDYIDSGTKRAVSGGSTDTTATANQSIFLCKKIGAWSNGTQVTGTVTHLQTGNTAGSTSTNKGDGYNTDDYTTGGVQAKFACIGGCTFAESGDAYCCGIFAYAK